MQKQNNKSNSALLKNSYKEGLLDAGFYNVIDIIKKFMKENQTKLIRIRLGTKYRIELANIKSIDEIINFIKKFTEEYSEVMNYYYKDYFFSDSNPSKLFFVDKRYIKWYERIIRQLLNFPTLNLILFYELNLI